MGKLNYGYRKLTAPKDQPACAACDITHGGMHFDETAAWKEAKAKMAQGSHAQMHQLHRDEMGADVRLAPLNRCSRLLVMCVLHTWTDHCRIPDEAVRRGAEAAVSNGFVW